jgi:lipopolysaccharide transport system permease protein
MLMFTLIFSRVAKLPSGGLPYPVFAFAALLPWTMFAGGIQQASQSLVGSASLVTKVYFPRLSLPLGAILPGAVDMGLSFVVLLGIMGWYRLPPSGRLILLPAFVALLMAVTLGVGLWLSALNVEYRDVKFVVPFLTQIWLFATPIAYPADVLGEPWRTILGLNPMTGVVEGFRWAVAGGEPPPRGHLMMAILVAFVLVGTGAVYFRRMEKNFADRV